MATNLDVNTAAIESLMEIAGFTTKRQAVDAAIQEALAYRKQLKSCGALGTIDFIPLALDGVSTKSSTNG